MKNYNLTFALDGLRNFFEACLNIRFILKENEEDRAATYYLNNRYDNLVIKSYDPIREKVYKDDKSEKMNKYYARKLQKDSQNLENLINRCDKLKEIENLRNSALKINSMNDMPVRYEKSLKYYKINKNDVTSVKELAQEVGWLDYYSYIYGQLSSGTHSTNTVINLDSVLCKPDIMIAEFILEYIKTFSFTVLYEVSEKLLYNNKDNSINIQEYKLCDCDLNQLEYKTLYSTLENKLNRIIDFRISLDYIKDVGYAENIQGIPEEERLVEYHDEINGFKLKVGVTEEQCMDKYNELVDNEFFDDHDV